jgi:hypothetical protein
MLYAASDSSVRGWASGFAWIWGLGPVRTDPDPAAVGFGDVGESAELARLVDEGRLRGAVIAASGAGPAHGVSPARRQVSGRASFDGGTTVRAELLSLEADGEIACRSSLGVHAVRRGAVLVLGIDPDASWGRMDAFWAYELIFAFLEDLLGSKLKRIPAIGALRLDDTPGTAQHQLEGRAKGDRRQRRRIRKTAKHLVDAGAVLNVAVTAEALQGEMRVPIHEVWPGSIQALHDGIRSGGYAPVCHGLLHLDTDVLARGEIEFREFASLDEAEAGRRLDIALAWQEEHLGERPSNFVAPAWSYGEHGVRAAEDRGLITWHRSRHGALLEGDRLFESLFGALQGIDRLDYSPLQRMSAIGIPPTVAMHGALLDSRLGELKKPGEALTLAALFVKRDIRRLIELDGITWLDTNGFVAALRAHENA